MQGHIHQQAIASCFVIATADFDQVLPHRYCTSWVCAIATVDAVGIEAGVHRGQAEGRPVRSCFEIGNQEVARVREVAPGREGEDRVVPG